MLNKRTQSEIDTFFFEKHNIPKELRAVTSSAFTQCRDKMKYTAFEDVFQMLVSHFYQEFDFKTYYGYRLVAIDGTVLTVPRNEETIEEFGENCLSNHKTWLKAQASFATDVLNNICLDAEIGKYVESEQNMALSHTSRLGENNLYIFDRGYFNFDFFEKILKTKKPILFQISKKCMF